jgi:hypothetical protein
VRDPQLVLLLVRPQVHHLAQVADLPKGPRHPPLPLTPLLTVHRPACIQVPNLQQGHPPVLLLVLHRGHHQAQPPVPPAVLLLVLLQARPLDLLLALLLGLPLVRPPVRPRVLLQAPQPDLL